MQSSTIVYFMQVEIAFSEGWYVGVGGMDELVSWLGPVKMRMRVCTRPLPR